MKYIRLIFGLFLLLVPSTILYLETFNKDREIAGVILFMIFTGVVLVTSAVDFKKKGLL